MRRVLALSAENLTMPQWNVLGSYCRAFATRGLDIERAASLAAGPYLFTDGSPIVEKAPHCYWNWGDNADVDADADGCAWIWHHGPRRPFPAGSPRLIVLPRNDLFEIRGIDNSPGGWAEYRSRLGVPWSEKLAEPYFLGSFSGSPGPANARVRACRLLQEAGLPANVGLTSDSIPPDLDFDVPLKQREPLHVMGQHKFVLSLWGNHQFNPRLYRGLEAGSLVFHQATPDIELLEDGVLVPGLHYVEIAPDLSDLLEQLEYFIAHPGEANEIAETGHRQWMEHLFVSTPYTVPDAVWERFTSQPDWPAFREAFDVH
jgi:hypothetical protein